MNKVFALIIALLSLTTAANAADTVFVALEVMPDTTVRMTSNGNSSTGEATKKLVISGLAVTDTLRMVRWDHPGDQPNESVEVFGLGAGGWTWLSLEGDLPNGDTLTANFVGYEAYLIRHVGGPGPGSQWVQVSRIQPASAFPVEWLGFEAKAISAGVELSWATAQELNNDRFEVERSTNGRSWKTIGSVTAAGFADSRSDYSFTDTDAPTGPAAYRLRQVDLDGAYDYSNVVEVMFSPLESDLRVSSLIDGSGAYVSGLTGRGTLTVTDLSGRQVAKITINGPGAIDLSDLQLPAGVYAASVTDGFGGFAAGKILLR